MSPTGLALLLVPLLLGASFPGFEAAPRHVRLFTPLHLPAGTYRAYVTSERLDEVLDRLRRDPAFGSPGSFEPKTVVALDAFGTTGPYNRWQLARLYGARRARVARGPRLEDGQVVEAWTLVSPYPDADLRRLEKGTLIIVLRTEAPPPSRSRRHADGDVAVDNVDR